MTPIPDSVMERARAVCAPSFSGVTRVDDAQHVIDVANVILAERERCAGIADAMSAKIGERLRKLEKPNADLAGAAAVGACDCADKIADAIRAGDHDRSEAIQAARAAIEAMQAWRPIETAPRDGSLFLVWAPGYQELPPMFSLCAWHPDAGFCIDELRHPTHWMPLPEPPKQEGAQ